MIVWVALLTSYEYSTGFCRKCALNVSILHAAYNLILIFTAIDCRQDYRVLERQFMKKDGLQGYIQGEDLLQKGLSPTID